MKTPITYYGGKQKMVNEIIPLIPMDHDFYVEPFFGGGTIFFAKTPSKAEVLNDKNELIINFYRQMQLNFDALNDEIIASLHSRILHRKANAIINNKIESTDLERAWAFYIACNQGFGSNIDHGWGYAKSDKNSFSIKLANKRNDFYSYKDRLKYVQIDCQDALDIIKLYDNEKAFFYLDPPYYNSDCGYYEGYSINDYQNLIDLIMTIKGRFLLSSYPNEIIDNMDWKFRKDFDKHRSINSFNSARKIETLVSNYEIKNKQHQLFN